MEVLSRLSRSAVLVVAGSLLIVAGVADTLSVGGITVSAAAWWQRATLVCLGLVCLTTAWYVTRSEKAMQPSAPQDYPPADSFLFTLDDGRRELAFPSMAEDADTISLMARTSVNIWSNYRNTVVSLLRAGVHMRVIIVDPICPVVDSIYGQHDSSIYLHNMRQMCDHLSKLAEELTRHGVSPDRLRLHLVEQVPPFSMLIVQKRDPAKSAINVQLSFLRTRISRDRPTFVVHAGDQWFAHFLAEFNQVWDHHSARTTIPELIQRVGQMGTAPA